jgi:hypothetical protein
MITRSAVRKKKKKNNDTKNLSPKGEVYAACQECQQSREYPGLQAWLRNTQSSGV